jgi:hypothetical protein
MDRRRLLSLLVCLVFASSARAAQDPSKHKKPGAKPAPKAETRLFDEGVSVKAWNNEDAWVWAHPKAKGRRVGLVIYLHGLIQLGSVGPHKMIESWSQMQADRKTWPWSINVARLAQKMIDDGNANPVIIAAPSEVKSRRASSTTIWNDFDLNGFIQQVGDLVKKEGVTLEPNRVGVVGWSGAGASAGSGLARIADKFGGRFTYDKQPYYLKVLGCADTGVNAGMANAYVSGLAKSTNPFTKIYSVHKRGGGTTTAGDPGNAQAIAYANALGAKSDVLKPANASLVSTETSELSNIDFFRSDSPNTDSPRHVVIRISEAKLRVHDAEWQAAQALYETKSSPTDVHGLMPLWWTWLALHRFF